HTRFSRDWSSDVCSSDLASTVSPNPMVGAVILHDGIIIGEGYTSPYGGSHAEVNAIQDAYQKLGKAEARNRFCKSTMYVSLEPRSEERRVGKESRATEQL